LEPGAQSDFATFMVEAYLSKTGVEPGVYVCNIGSGVGEILADSVYEQYRSYQF